MSARPGAASVAELLLVCWAFALVLLVLAEFVAGQGRLARRQSVLVRAQEARRTIEVVLGREIRSLAAADLRPLGADAVALRAVRGSGPVCAAADRALGLRYTGTRWPDPDKDSLLLSGVDGDEVRAVVGVRGGGCGGAADALTVTLDRPAAASVGFALVFEPGSYHGHDRAVRYRLGRAGRQPLTEAVFRKVEVRPAPGGPGLIVGLRTDPDALHALDRRLDLRIPSLNPPSP